MERSGLVIVAVAFTALAVVLAVEAMGFRSAASYTPRGEDRSATTTGMSMQFNSKGRSF
jgi:hypothetical protein